MPSRTFPACSYDTSTRYYTTTDDDSYGDTGVFDIEDHRRRDSGLTSSQLLRRNLAATLRARYHRVRSFSACGAAAASGGSSSASRSPTKQRESDPLLLSAPAPGEQQQQSQRQQLRVFVRYGSTEGGGDRGRISAAVRFCRRRRRDDVQGV